MTEIKNKIRRNLAVCTKIKYKISKKALISIYHSLIESHVRYGITSWCFGNETLKNSIQRSCDQFIKMALNIYDSSQLNTMMKEQKLLTIDQVLFVEIGFAMFKIHNNMFPTPINDFFTKPSHQMTTRSRRNFLLGKPRIELTRQSVNFRGIKIWNNIPVAVKYINCHHPTTYRSLKSFKKRLTNYVTERGAAFIRSKLN